MNRTFVFLVVILGAALLLETGYHFATVGFLGDAAQYPTPQQFAIDAGLAPKPKPRPPRPPPLPIAASAAPAASGLPASSAPPLASSSLPASAAAPASSGPAAQPAAAKPHHKAHRSETRRASPLPDATAEGGPPAPPQPPPPSQGITAPY